MDPDDTTFYIGLNRSSQAFGYIVGPIIGSTMYNLDGFYAPFVVVGSILIFLSFIMFPNTLDLGKI